MKKLILITALFAICGTLTFGQGLLRPVPNFKTERINGATKLINLKDFKWQMRFDGTIQLNENLYNKDTKQLESKMAAGIGLAVGFQHYVPKSDVDPTPVNDYGFSVGLLNQNYLKIIGQVNIWQYIKFGPTFTPNMPAPYSKLGFFIGSGITF